jgi:hypothetical protein
MLGNAFLRCDFQPKPRGVTLLPMAAPVSNELLLGLRVFAVAAGLYLVGSTFLSAVKTVVLPRATSQKITRSMFIIMRRMFDFVAHGKRDFADRDRILAVYAPLTFVLLPLLWLILTIAGFTAVQWGINGGSLRDSFLVSGSSMLTLGVKFRNDLPSAVFSYLQAAIGLVLVALLISYLPTIYGSFSRRETLVGMLDSRAGIPPSPYELLVRYERIGASGIIDTDLFAKWEEWFAELEESHTSFAALVFFRSPRPERSWITAAGCVLDTAALHLSTVDRPFSGQAALCCRQGFLALRRLADLYGIPVNHEPSPTDPISVSRREYDNMLIELRAAGIPIRTDVDRAWADFVGWRVNYDTALVGIAKLVVAPEGRWSSDREADRLVPKLRRGPGGQTRSRKHTSSRTGRK